ncbi:MAG: tetratricopeptide repeat protein, partial [Acidimicrobiia bacterium]
AYLALGTFLLDLNRNDAVETLGQAVMLSPDNAPAAERYARALAQAGRFAEALAEHERGRRLEPDSGVHILSQAETLVQAGRQAEADELSRHLIEAPKIGAEDKALAHQQRAVWALARGDVASARCDLDAALALAPDRDDIRQRRAMLLLSLGQFDPGWKEFRSRFSRTMVGAGTIHAQPFLQPPWMGEDLRDRAILVWGEQGIGDDIVAASMLPDLAKRAREVLLHTDGRLEPLFTRSFPSNVRFFARILPVQPELLSSRIACQIPLGGLGEFLRPSSESFGTPRAYLHADPAKAEHFRRRYEALPGLKVGISWRSRNLANGRIKSTSLDEWQPILRLPNVTFINLQYGDCSEDLARAQEHTGCRIHHDPEVDQLRDMYTFAAQVASLDLVISVSNAIAHTAGALGVPTWVLLATDHLWLWFRDRDDSPWYPRVRLFRQTRPGDWSEPVRQVAANLEAWPSPQS